MTFRKTTVILFLPLMAIFAIVLFLSFAKSACAEDGICGPIGVKGVAFYGYPALNSNNIPAAKESNKMPGLLKIALLMKGSYKVNSVSIKSRIVDNYFDPDKGQVYKEIAVEPGTAGGAPQEMFLTRNAGMKYYYTTSVPIAAGWTGDEDYYTGGEWKVDNVFLAGDEAHIGLGWSSDWMPIKGKAYVGQYGGDIWKGLCGREDDPDPGPFPCWEPGPMVRFNVHQDGSASVWYTLWTQTYVSAFYLVNARYGGSPLYPEFILVPSGYTNSPDGFLNYTNFQMGPLYSADLADYSGQTVQWLDLQTSEEDSPYGGCLVTEMGPPPAWLSHYIQTYDASKPRLTTYSDGFNTVVKDPRSCNVPQ